MCSLVSYVLCIYVVIFSCDTELWLYLFVVFFFQAEDGIRDLVRSRGLGDVYKRQAQVEKDQAQNVHRLQRVRMLLAEPGKADLNHLLLCLLYTSDAADERSSVDLGGRRIIKKKKKVQPVSISRKERKMINTYKT